MFEFVEKRETTGELKLPARKTIKSAGYDFFVPGSCDGYIIQPGKKVFFWSDIKCKMPNNYFLALHIRSSLGIKHNLRLANVTGIIDADYYNNPDNEGNIGFCIKNESEVPYTLRAGESIAQGILQKYEIDINEITPDTKRTGGIGSTGR